MPRLELDYEFAVIPRQMFDKYSGLTIAVWGALWTYTDSASRSCFPSIESLAKRSGVSASTVKRQLKLLETEGLISITGRASESGKQTSNIYKLNVHKFSKPKKARAVKPGQTDLEGRSERTGSRVTQTYEEEPV